MSQNASAPGQAPTLQQPPDEAFWQRYSPHHEAPLSGVMSFGLHILAVAAVALVVWFATAKMRELDPPPVEAVSMAPLGPGGEVPGNGAAEGPRGEEPGNNANPKPGAPGPDRPDLSGNDQPTPLSAGIDEAAVERNIQKLIDEGKGGWQAIESLNQDVRKRLKDALTKGGGKPSGGGDGGTGGTGGSPVGNIRVERVARWHLVYETSSARDYLRQLADCGAWVMVPLPRDEKRFLLFKDLGAAKPQAAELGLADLGKITLFWAIDDRADSVSRLASGLGVDPKTRHAIVFYPAEFEQQLVKLEGAYRKKSEQEIEQTTFRFRLEEGKVRPYVADQKLKR